MNSVNLTLELRTVAGAGSTQVEGVVTGSDGRPREFSGWMALLGLLEDAAGAVPAEATR